MKKLSVLLVFVLTLTMALSFSASAYKLNESWGNVIEVSEKIDVDGIREDVYDQGVHVIVDRFLDDYHSEGSGEAWIVWKNGYLFIFFDVTDPDINEPDAVGESAAPWTFDSCEVFLDFGNDGIDSYQYRVGVSGYPSNYKNGNYVAVGEDECNGTFNWASAATDNGYTAEFKIPLEDAEVGYALGIQFQINDMYNNGTRATIMSQSSLPAASWSIMEYDYIVLADEEGYAPVVEDTTADTEEDTTADTEEDTTADTEEDTTADTEEDTTADTEEDTTADTEDDKTTTTAADKDADNKEDGSFPWWIIVAAAAVIIVVVVIIVINKSKK